MATLTEKQKTRLLDNTTDSPVLLLYYEMFEESFPFQDELEAPFFNYVWEHCYGYKTEEAPYEVFYNVFGRVEDAKELENLLENAVDSIVEKILEYPEICQLFESCGYEPRMGIIEAIWYYYDSCKENMEPYLQDERKAL